MKRSSTTSSVNKSEETPANNSARPNINSLSDSFNHISLSLSSNTLHVDDQTKLLSDDELHKRKASCCSVQLVIDESTENTNTTKSKSLTTLKIEDKSDLTINTINKDSNTTQSKSELKLVSPYGDWCAFTGGSGSGGCIFTGPYEPMIIPKEDYSDESFESTEESDANIDFIGPIGITHNNFKNTEVVWAKRPALPWFPGIIIDPNMINKEIKDLMRHLGASAPHKDQLADYSLAVINSKDTDKLYFVFLFNRKKTWIWLPESKLRPFCKENDKLFLDNSPLLTSKYKKELEKAYKKAKRFAKNSSPVITLNDHHISTSKNSHSHSNEKH